jgi:NarL family two-component system response regulator LiaR
MLVDDHAIVRSGLSAFLLAYDGLEMVAEASNGEQALGLCERVKPDVILMDLVMPGIGGVEATRRIRKHYPAIEIIALTSFQDVEMIRAVLAVGAKGYLIKTASADELADAIFRVHAGEPILASEVTKKLVAHANRPDPVTFDLSEREMEILFLIAEGLKNPEIAEHLVISRSTVKFHVSNILSKMGVNNRTEAVALAIKHNMVI